MTANCFRLEFSPRGFYFEETLRLPHPPAQNRWNPIDARSQWFTPQSTWSISWSTGGLAFSRPTQKGGDGLMTNSALWLKEGVEFFIVLLNIWQRFSLEFSKCHLKRLSLQHTRPHLPSVFCCLVFFTRLVWHQLFNCRPVGAHVLPGRLQFLYCVRLQTTWRTLTDGDPCQASRWRGTGNHDSCSDPVKTFSSTVGRRTMVGWKHANSADWSVCSSSGIWSSVQSVCSIIYGTWFLHTEGYWGGGGAGHQRFSLTLSVTAFSGESLNWIQASKCF